MKELICIMCPVGCHIKVDDQNNYVVTGNACEKGVVYGKEELTNPTRIITSTVKIKGGLYPRCPVKTTDAIPKKLIFDAMKLLCTVELRSPVKSGDVVIKDILGTGVSFVTTRDQ